MYFFFKCLQDSKNSIIVSPCEDDHKAEVNDEDDAILEQSFAQLKLSFQTYAEKKLDVVKYLLQFLFIVKTLRKVINTSENSLANGT